jgi:two-component system, chemotaxis family, CheB/CheR fusion protein
MHGELESLFHAVDIPIVTVGTDLRVRWATLPAEALFRVRAVDVGRPIGQLRHVLDLDDFDAHLRAVIETGASQRIEARDTSGRRWAVLLRPLIGRDGETDGAVLLALDLEPEVGALRTGGGEAVGEAAGETS